MLEQHFVFS